MEHRIPKIIHWCWFSGDDEIPDEVHRCIESWRIHCPDWRIKKWDLSNFDVSQHHYTRHFAASEAWAFLSDYVRLDALIKEGGVYLDSDVRLMHPIDAFTENKAFISFPLRVAHFRFVGVQLQVEMMGAVAGSIFIKKCLANLKNDFEAKKKTNLRFLMLQTVRQYSLPMRSVRPFLQRKTVYFRDFTILEQKYFLDRDCFTGSEEDWQAAYAIHLAAGSWWRQEQAQPVPMHMPVPTPVPKSKIKRYIKYVLSRLLLYLVLCHRAFLCLDKRKKNITVFDLALYDRLKEPVHPSP